MDMDKHAAYTLATLPIAGDPTGLSLAERERLAKLSEECGEIVQVIGKILAHGFESKHPDGGPTNREMLAAEVGDFAAIQELMTDRGDFKEEIVNRQYRFKRKALLIRMKHQLKPVD